MTVAQLLDEVSPRILAAWHRNEIPQRIMIHTSLYDEIVGAKLRELRRGNPILLLGLEIIPSESLPRDRVVIF
jgi:hypothetical protein